MADLSVQSSSKSTAPLRRDPFSMLQGEINRVFSSFDRGWPDGADVEFKPSTDVSETDQQIKVTAELPGLESKDVKIELVDDILTISGEKKTSTDNTSEKRHVIERSYGSFARSLQLPAGVKEQDIEAALANGVLTVTIRKPEIRKPQARTIAVSTPG